MTGQGRLDNEISSVFHQAPTFEGSDPAHSEHDRCLALVPRIQPCRDRVGFTTGIRSAMRYRATIVDFPAPFGPANTQN
jgi:hypothetical protein